MSLIDVQWEPTKRQLRQFGVIAFVALPLVGWIWGASATWLGILAGVGAVLAVAGFIAPPVVKPVFIGLTLVTLPIGLVIGELAMALIYFGLFLPFGLVFRLIGRDALSLKPQTARGTFWREKAQAKDAASYFRQS